jgi:predicted membrane metal-binding protein
MAQVDSQRGYGKLTMIALALGGFGVLLTWLASAAPVTCDLVNNCYPELPGIAATVGTVILVVAVVALLVLARNVRRFRVSRILALVVIVLSLVIPIVTYVASTFTTPWI